MAAFNEVIPLQRGETNKEGTELTVYDLHDYINNDEGIIYADVVSRTFTFYDSDGNEIGIVDATVVLDDDYSVTITVDKDRYIESHLLIVLNDATEYLNIEKIGCINQALYKRTLIIDGNRTNRRNSYNDVLDKSLEFIEDAVYGHKFGDASYLFDERISDANKLLDSVNKC